jgi:hypothetical protein
LRSVVFVTDADNAEWTLVFFGGEDMVLNAHVFADLLGRLGEEMQGTCEGVVDGYVIAVTAKEKDVPMVAVPD